MVTVPYVMLAYNDLRTVQYICDSSKLFSLKSVEVSRAGTVNPKGSEIQGQCEILF